MNRWKVLLIIVVMLLAPFIGIAMAYYGEDFFRSVNGSKDIKNSEIIIAAEKNTERTLPLKNLKEIAKQVTIIIGHGNKIIGSGVILSIEKESIHILTAKHVIGISPGKQEDPYTVTLNNGKSFKINHNNYDTVVRYSSNNIDFAILSFQLDEPLNLNIIKTVKLSNSLSSISSGSSIYIFGYLPCLLNTKKIGSQPNQFSPGKILKIDNPQQDPTTHLQGYDIQYNNNTIEGMSGSPIFDKQGSLIGIHAKTEKNDKRKYESNQCENLPTKPDTNFGNNWGISISNLSTIISKVNISSGIKKQIDNLNPLPIDKQPIIRKIENQECPVFIIEDFECKENGEGNPLFIPLPSN